MNLASFPYDVGIESFPYMYMNKCSCACFCVCVCGGEREREKRTNSIEKLRKIISDPHRLVLVSFWLHTELSISFSFSFFVSFGILRGF